MLGEDGPLGKAGDAFGTLASISRSQRWLSRLAFAAPLAGAAVLLLAGGLKSVTALLLGFAGLASVCSSAWWFLAHRGIGRTLAGVVLVAALVAVIVLYVAAGPPIYCLDIALISLHLVRCPQARHRTGTLAPLASPG